MLLDECLHDCPLPVFTSFWQFHGQFRFERFHDLHKSCQGLEEFQEKFVVILSTNSLTIGKDVDALPGASARARQRRSN